jgi:cyclopropane-fatty-acyl-phospholipid synthase
MVGHSLSTIDRWLTGKIQDSVDNRVGVHLRPNANATSPNGHYPHGITVSDRRTLYKLMLNPEIAFGDAYMRGELEVQGDLVGLLENVFRAMQKSGRVGWYSRAASWWLAQVQRNSLRGARRNIHRHYDLDTNFYKLWLDDRLVYTCAYFPTPSATLEEAQIAKMDYVCRKVQLKPGDRVVEAGCGWGSLALHMAKHYGAKVKAFNISHEQIRYAREQAEMQGLTDDVEFIEDDYRNISGKFDVFMSVGMLEHIGASNYPPLSRVIHRTIGHTGRGLLHFIGRNRVLPLSAWIRKTIFPGAYPPTLRESMNVLEPNDYSVFDVENLRVHYAMTLEHWLNRFELAADSVRRRFGPEFVRAWRLYLAGSLASYRVGMLQLFQVVFAGREYRGIPLTRANLYSRQSHEQKEVRWMHAMS